MAILERIEDFYQWSLEKGCEQTVDWPLMKTPIPILIITALYVLIVITGPKLMADRKPFHLKHIIVPYNFAMMFLSTYIFHEFLVGTTVAGYSYTCQKVDYTYNDHAMRINFANWVFFFSKIIELLDTIFFILRKKNSQITFLHVWHHATMAPFWWLVVKYIPNGQPFFIALCNSFVHILMYFYYGMSSIGPHMQKYLWWKKYLTKIQLTQFCMVITHATTGYLSGCDFPHGYTLFASAYGVILIILFANFYRQAYVKKKTNLKAA